MMDFFKWADNKITNFRWYDIALTKLSVLAFAFLIAKLCPELLGLDWQIILAAGMGFALPVFIKMLK